MKARGLHMWGHHMKEELRNNCWSSRTEPSAAAGYATPTPSWRPSPYRTSFRPRRQPQHYRRNCPTPNKDRFRCHSGRPAFADSSPPFPHTLWIAAAGDWRSFDWFASAWQSFGVAAPAPFGSGNMYCSRSMRWGDSTIPAKNWSTAILRGAVQMKHIDLTLLDAVGIPRMSAHRSTIANPTSARRWPIASLPRNDRRYCHRHSNVRSFRR